MAKIKVYELAQEIGVKSAEILTILKNKGIEVKSHMSVLEDRQIDEVKNTLKAPAKLDEAPKKTEAKAPVKKKKSIIVVSNPHNSKLPGAQIPRKPAHPEKKAAAKQETAIKQEAAVKAKQETAVKTEPAVKQQATAKVETLVQPETAVKAVAAAKQETVVKTENAAKADVIENAAKVKTAEKSAEKVVLKADNTEINQVTEKQSVEKQSIEKQFIEKQSIEKQSMEKQSIEKQSIEKQSMEKQSMEKQSMEKQQTTENQATEKQFTEKQQTTENQQSTEKQQTAEKQQTEEKQQITVKQQTAEKQQTTEKQFSDKKSTEKQSKDKYSKVTENVKAEVTAAEEAKKASGGRKNVDGQKRDGARGSDNSRRDGQKNDGNKNADRQKRSDGSRRDGQRNDNRSESSRNSDGKRYDGGRDRDKDRNSDGQRRGDRDKGSDGQRRDRGQGGRNGQGFSGGRDNNRNGYGGNGGRNSGKNSFVPDSPMKESEKHRDEEKRRISQEKDKKNRKDLIYEEDNEIKNIKGKNKPGKFIKPEKKPVETVAEQIKVITLPEKLTIKELADKMKIQPSAIVKKLFLQGQIVTVNEEITYETAENIAIEYDIICEQEVKVDVIEELLREEEENVEDMVQRPPVICVMGHVDHGKTSLLDAIRKTNVTDREAGGITQHIGAYTVNVNGQKITFLDTPGHEAFTAMRMRGANSTDIAILVVAADDGVMPQTVEAINHAKAAEIEIIVAVNKIDKPGANIERVKQELTEYGLIAEDWGGSTVFVPVSAKSGEGIEQLLEMILLTAEVLELKANPDRRARGLVIEAELDKGRGPVATVLVQKGTLKVGDFISAGAASGKVRAMIDDKGRRVKEAGPSTPVEILGLGDVPNAGEIFIAHQNDKEAKNFAETFVAQNKEKLLEDTKAKMSLDDLFSQIQAGNLKELNLIIKADVQGSVEAVKQSLMKLSNEEVVVKCIHGGVGAINESDVILASASKAIIIGFNVRPDAIAKATAEREGIDVRLYKVIYQAIEDIESAMKGMLDPIFEEKVIGHAEVRQIFRASAVGNIAGSYVLDGMFQRGCKVRITREGEQIYEGALASLKRFKDDVKEVKAGFECGLVFEGYDSMQELDIVEAYIMVEVPR